MSDNKDLIKVCFHDSDECFRVSEIGIISIKKGATIDGGLIFDIFNHLWNGGDSFETYEDYIENFEEDAFIKEHFNELVEATLSCGWSVESFANVGKIIYPEANIEFINMKYDFDFYY